MIQGHGGNIYALAQRLGCRPEEIIDVSSNINPLGPPPGLMAHLKDQLETVCVLPEVDSRTITRQMAGSLGLDESNLLAGAGTTQFIYAMFAVLAARQVLIVGPTYADYADACRMSGVSPQFFLCEAKDRFQPVLERLAEQAARADTVVVCNPNNPTGVLIPKRDLDALCRSCPGTRFVIDESYLPFVPTADAESMATCGLDNVIVLHSLSKIYRLPGLRIGFLIAPAPVIEQFRNVMPPWRLNSLAQVAARFLSEQRVEVDRFVARTQDFIADERERFAARAQAAEGLTLFPSRTSYMLMQLPATLTADQVCRRFEREQILIRHCGNFFGLGDRYVRMALNLPDVNERVARVLVESVSG